MSLKQAVDQQLKCASDTLAATGTLPPLVVKLTSGQLCAELTAVDQLACAFKLLSFESTCLEEASVERLQQVAADLSARLSYLLEPISPIEVDAESCVVQLRSTPPARDDDGTRFYELVVQRDQLTLCRYVQTPRQPRQVVPAEVTREVLGRLAEDIVEAVS